MNKSKGITIWACEVCGADNPDQSNECLRCQNPRLKEEPVPSTRAMREALEQARKGIIALRIQIGGEAFVTGTIAEWAASNPLIQQIDAALSPPNGAPSRGEFSVPEGWMLVTGSQAKGHMCMRYNIFEQNWMGPIIGMDSPECLYALPDASAFPNDFTPVQPNQPNAPEPSGSPCGAVPGRVPMTSGQGEGLTVQARIKEIRERLRLFDTVNTEDALDSVIKELESTAIEDRRFLLSEIERLTKTGTPEPKAQEPVSTEEWKCWFCDALNPEASERCSKCGNLRQGAPSVPPLSGGVGEPFEWPVGSGNWYTEVEFFGPNGKPLGYIFDEGGGWEVGTMVGERWAGPFRYAIPATTPTHVGREEEKDV